jgi:RHS repeat-associated protein
VQKTVGSTVTTYAYDAAGQLADEYSTATPAFIGTEYLMNDTLGSTRLVLDETGTVKERIDYLPFGEEIATPIGGRAAPYTAFAYPTNPDIEAQKFTGKERDAETGLDFFGARYFSGPQGRFSSVDPVIVTPARTEDPQRFNLYSYARNNPFSFIDPDGEDIEFANNTEEGRKKALAAILKNVSDQEAANIGIRLRKDGSYEAYVIDPKAIGKDASKAYKDLTGLINDHSIVADVGLVGGGLTATFGQGALAGRTISSFSIMGGEGGATFEKVNRHVNILVNQGDLPGGVDIFCCGGTGTGVEPDFVTMWHELLGETLKYRAGHQSLLHNPALDSRTVIKIENEIRAVHGMSPRTGADHGNTTITVQGKVQ